MSQVTRSFDFEVTARAGDARAGTLRISEQQLETPNLFPVLNFYAGGTERSVFGGGVHRTIKEFMIGADCIGGCDYTEFFDCIMTSVASLTDYNITHERYQSYLDTPIKQRELFEPFNGVVFADSGGFKFLGGDEIDGSDFEVEIDQEKIYKIQQKMGADIIVNLDHPIAPDDTHNERINKAQQTADNIAEFLELSADFEGARYLTLHGYNYSMMDAFLDTVTDVIDTRELHQEFDGVALGSLVPKKDNHDALISAVIDCREVLQDWGFDDLPLHVLGISSRAIPLLAALGVDTFDASSYLHTAINGKYSRSFMDTVQIDDAVFEECDCPVCSSQMLRERMNGNVEYQKDMLGAVAMHNLIVQKQELAKIRNLIASNEIAPLREYIESTIAQDKQSRQAAHRVVNQSLGGYF
jgi:tRNA-guanine family transglycosylase